MLHFSEDPAITRFVPHVAATAQQSNPYVWAVGRDRAPDCWFPRQCPRAMAWTGPHTTSHDRERILGAGCGDRVNAIEYGRLDALRTVQLWAYRLPAKDFEPFGAPDPHAQVFMRAVTPVGDLLALHEAARIQLRVLDSLWPLWYAITGNSVLFSGIRLSKAQPRPRARAGLRAGARAEGALKRHGRAARGGQCLGGASFDVR